MHKYKLINWQGFISVSYRGVEKNIEEKYPRRYHRRKKLKKRKSTSKLTNVFNFYFLYWQDLATCKVSNLLMTGLSSEQPLSSPSLSIPNICSFLPFLFQAKKDKKRVKKATATWTVPMWRVRRSRSLSHSAFRLRRAGNPAPSAAAADAPTTFLTTTTIGSILDSIKCSATNLWKFLVIVYILLVGGGGAGCYYFNFIQKNLVRKM